VISSLLKQLMSACKLQQKDLAEVLEVPIDRVKSLTSGRVKNLTREESEALIAQLNIRADWLITGEGPMFQPDEETQDAFITRQQSINRTTELVQALPLSKINRSRLAVLLTGDPLQDAALIANAIRAQELSPRASALLDNYEHADDAGKKIIEGTASLAAQPKAARSGK
jgi:DNA-binding Xre family transcriptional regulator